MGAFKRPRFDAITGCSRLLRHILQGFFISHRITERWTAWITGDRGASLIHGNGMAAVFWLSPPALQVADRASKRMKATFP